MSERQPWESDDEEPTTDYALQWAFLNQAWDFVLGVEATMIYERMRRGESAFKATTHADNEEELRHLANHFKYRAIVKDCGDGCWQFVEFISVSSRGAHP